MIIRKLADTPDLFFPKYLSKFPFLIVSTKYKLGTSSHDIPIVSTRKILVYRKEFNHTQLLSFLQKCKPCSFISALP